ncbi:uncharacterized protein LOC141588126 [Silene latifolia]|uniref:uncharacterized protein LOC141588126 n=1 Tax=Silene latifolia TaxID=37657 RepID=UPI003D773A0E
MNQFGYDLFNLHCNSIFENDCFSNDIENEDKGELIEDDEEVEPPPQLVKGLEEYDQRSSVIEDIETINMGTLVQPKELKIGTTLDPEKRRGFINLLGAFKDVFALSYKDMPGIDREIAEHKIPIKPGFKPVKQKLRRMRTEWSLKVKEEIDKQFKAGFIKVSEYSDWIANVVPVPKKDGKVRVCMDFRDLNKKLKVGEHEIWDEQCQAAFDKVKEVLSSPPVLSPPVSGLPLSLMSRWTLMLSEFDLKYVPLKAIKGRVVVDFLAENPIEETEAIDTWSFPDENVIHIEDDVWDLYFDGASNYMGYGVGILLISPTGEHVPVSIKLDFNVTNNAAEYEACLLGLCSALELGVKRLLVNGDSSLVINQVTGSWKIKSENLAPYQMRIEELERFFNDVKYVHLPRDENQFADALSKLTALINIPEHMDSMPICVKRRSAPSYVNAIDNPEESETDLWYTAILKYKETGEYPSDLDTRGKWALRMFAAQFIKTDDGQLYKKTAQGVLLRCIDKSTFEKVMEV